MTHPFHPLAGQRLRVLLERRVAGALVFSCEGGPAGSVVLPVSWTDQGGPPADGPLTYEVVIELAGVISAVKSAQVR